MEPDDIPSSVTKQIYNAHSVGDCFYPASMLQNDAAKMLAQFWPAIEAHIRERVADEFTRRGRAQATFTWGEANLIARGEI